MKYMMVFIGILFYKVASGLCLYFIASTLWSLGERRLLPKAAPASGAPAPGQSTPVPSTDDAPQRGEMRKKERQKQRRN
jgi:YidC/Oxa1 family membrane protein insertase